MGTHLILYADVITHTQRMEPLYVFVEPFELTTVPFRERDLPVVNSEDPLLSWTVLARMRREDVPDLARVDNLSGG